MEYRIIVSGFGGQGVLFFGKTLAQAAVMEGKEVSWLPSYGPEMRGGTANCRVIISDEEIASPAFNRAEAVIAMNVPSVDKFMDCASELVITDESFDVGNKADIELLRVNTEPCRGGEFDKLTNMVMMGAFIAKTNVVSYESVAEVIRATAGAYAETDLAAIRYGMGKLNNTKLPL